MTFEKTFLDPLSREEIIRKVKSFHPGSSHQIMLQEGSPIAIGDETLYVTEILNLRFHIDYNKIAPIKLRNDIWAADTPEKVIDCAQRFDAFKRKNLIPGQTCRELVRKKEQVDRKEEITMKLRSDRASSWDVEDKSISFIVRDKNTRLERLVGYNSFKNKIKSVKGGFEFETEITHRYFVKKADGRIFEITDTEGVKKREEALKLARITARETAGKPEGKESVCYAPYLSLVLNIW